MRMPQFSRKVMTQKTFPIRKASEKLFDRVLNIFFYSEELHNVHCSPCMATLIEVFPCFFLSCKANARVKPAKTGSGPHSS